MLKNQTRMFNENCKRACFTLSFETLVTASKNSKNFKFPWALSGVMCDSVVEAEVATRDQLCGEHKYFCFDISSPCEMERLKKKGRETESRLWKGLVVGFS